MSENRIDIKLLASPLSVDDCRDFIADAYCGGEVIFVGTVRNHTQGKEVLRLEFEAYGPMAVSEMSKIAKRIESRPDVHKVAIYHREGVLDIGEIPVIIGVSAAHRGAAFEACQYAIDTLKETVPIWKKEIFLDGEVWVAAHP